MMEFDIPGFRRLQIRHLVLDYNGTIAVDGILLEGVGERIRALAEHLAIHVITAGHLWQCCQTGSWIAAGSEDSGI